jgi:hypothetical protein
MMAEIFMLRLEAAARAAKEAAGTSARFVLITLPTAKARLNGSPAEPASLGVPTTSRARPVAFTC